MPRLSPRPGIAASLLALTLPLALQAQAPREASRNIGTTTTRSSTAKGPLPDPQLLDGSALEAEKRPEYGMLGEFEMPGAENANSDKVGGDPQNAGGGGGEQSNKGEPPPMGGGAPAGPPGGGAADPNAESPQTSPGGATGGQSQQKPGGGNSGGQGDPGAAPEGTQVGEMSGSGGTGQSGPAPSTKPQQVALGDSAMKINNQGGTAPGVVGAERAQATGKEVPQQYDARTPGGGKQSGAGKGNQGVEKGRVMPTGI